MRYPRARRDFLVLAGSALAAPAVLFAQARRAVPAVGVLWHAGSAKEEGEYFTIFLQGMRDQGYVDGQNVQYEHRFANEEYDRFNTLAAELVAMKVDVLVAITQPAALAARRATKEVPVVFVLVPDPLGTKLVASLAKPGGNMTGFSNMAVDITAKRLQILKEALPSLTRAALLLNPSDTSLSHRTIAAVQSAARPLNLTVRIYEAAAPDALDAAFSSISRDNVQAVLTGYDPMFTNERKQLSELALSRRLPMITQSRPGAVAGSLMSYGTDSRLIFRRSGIYVDRILKGAKPRDLPVEQPTKFELVINLNTAKALGITLPPSLIVSATEIIGA